MYDRVNNTDEPEKKFERMIEMSKMKKEFREEIIARLNELFDRAYAAPNKNIALRFFIDLEGETVDDVHVMDGTEYRGNLFQVSLHTNSYVARARRRKKDWIESQMDEIEREYEMKDWMP